MGLRERFHDLGKTSVEHQADALREQSEDAGGDDLTALAPRHPAVVCGTVRTVTLPPRREFQRLHIGIPHLLTCHQSSQIDRNQIILYDPVQLIPKLVRHASRAVVAVEFPVTAGRIDRLVYRPDDVGHGYFVGQS